VIVGGTVHSLSSDGSGSDSEANHIVEGENRPHSVILDRNALIFLP